MLKLRDRMNFRPRRGMARLFSAALVIGVLGLVPIAGGDAVAADFYKGKTFTVMVASRPGGGTDTTGRLAGDLFGIFQSD